jgi:non-specific serine/threonine protein kinase
LVTLVGPGGIGKTRLARRLADDAARAFPDGTFLLELAGLRDAGALMTGLASVLGLEGLTHTPQAAIVEFLGRRHVLLVLDNCEHLLDGCASLSSLLLTKAPGLRMIATSRQPLGVPGEQLMNVGPLSLPAPDETRHRRSDSEAMELFAERASLVMPSFELHPDNAESVGRLCTVLDGMPLAIELAAARLRVLSLSQLADRLRDRFGVLAVAATAGMPRHQTLRASVDWSFDLCSPDEQALWARMSVFEGGADLEAVEAVCPDPGVQIFDAVAGLVDKSVLVPHEVAGRVRYRMLETIREYGAERLAERRETVETRSRHHEHFIGFAHRARASWVGPDQLDWLNLVSADLGNLRAAFEHSLADAADPSGALELVTCLVWYWSPAGAPDEGATWFSRALADRDEPSPSLLHALAAAAILAGDRSDVDTALTVARRASSMPYREDRAVDRAAHYIAAATEALVARAESAAAAAYRRALAAYQDGDDLYGQLEALAMVGILTGRLGRTDEALSTFEQGKRLCDAHGEVIMRGQLLDYTGDLLLRAGRPEDAQVALRECLEGWSILRPAALCSSMSQAARIHAAGGRSRSAAMLFGARDRIEDDHGLLIGPLDTGGVAERTRAMLLEELGDEEFQAAFDEGYAMGRRDAVQLALGHAPATRAQTGDETYPAVLSKRESQVAALLARGLSNKDIAEELVVSPRTAEGHVAKVMDKLGVRSREQVAAWLTAGPSDQE